MSGVLGASATEALVVGHIGACGSGKTYRLKLRVAAQLRAGWQGSVLVADVRGEWPTAEGSGELGPLLYGSPPITMRGVRGVPTRLDPGALTVARPRAGSDELEWFAGLCRVAWERGDAVVVAPEVWRYAREHERLSPELERIVHEHRHRRVGLWWDAQSFAEVKKELVRRSGWIWVHGTGAHEDLRRLEAMGGRGLSAAVVDAQRRNVYSRSGHHVMFRAANPMPPWEVRGPGGELVASWGDAGEPLASGGTRIDAERGARGGRTKLR